MYGHTQGNCLLGVTVFDPLDVSRLVAALSHFNASSPEDPQDDSSRCSVLVCDLLHRFGGVQGNDLFLGQFSLLPHDVIPFVWVWVFALQPRR